MSYTVFEDYNYLKKFKLKRNQHSESDFQSKSFLEMSKDFQNTIQLKD